MFAKADIVLARKDSVIVIPKRLLFRASVANQFSLSTMVLLQKNASLLATKTRMKQK